MNKKQNKQKNIPENNPSPSIISLKWNTLKGNVWLVPFALLIILIILFSLKQISNLDIGFNLKGGQWVIDNKAFHGKDVYTYTVSGNDYINLHWLYQVMLYAVYSIFNYIGVTVLNAILILSLFYLLFKRMLLYGIPFSYSIPLLLLALVIIQMRFSYRPEVMTWLGIMLMLVLLDSYTINKKKLLHFAPVVMLFWVNMHGLFEIGIFILAAYFVSLWKTNKTFDKYFLKWFLISIAAVFVNPYFITGALFPFYLFTRLQSSNVFKNSITELKSPWEFTNIFGFEIYAFAAVGILALLLLIFTFKKRKLHEYIIFAGFAYISFRAYRNIPVFVIYAIHIIAVSLHEISYRRQIRQIIEKVKIFGKYISYGIALVMILISARVITNSYYASYGTGVDFGIGLNQTAFPVKAVEFIKTNNLNGKMLNHFNFGSWFIWQLDQPVFIDGRLEVMKEEFYSEYMKSFSAGGLQQMINKYNPDIIAYEHYSGYQWTEQLLKMPGWKLVYFDELAAVFIRNEYRPGLPVYRFDEFQIASQFNTRTQYDNASELITNGKLRNSKFWLNGFYTKYENRNDLTSLAMFAMDNGQFKIAENFYLEYLSASGGYMQEEIYKDVYNNLGSAFYNSKNYQNAKVCFGKYLEADPVNQNVIKLYNSVK